MGTSLRSLSALTTVIAVFFAALFWRDALPLIALGVFLIVASFWLMTGRVPWPGIGGNSPWDPVLVDYVEKVMATLVFGGVVVMAAAYQFEAADRAFRHSIGADYFANETRGLFKYALMSAVVSLGLLPFIARIMRQSRTATILQIGVTFGLCALLPTTAFIALGTLPAVLLCIWNPDIFASWTRKPSAKIESN